MVELWQAILLSLAAVVVGGIMTLAVSYATHCWTTEAARKAEERQAAYKVKEEERQYIRQHRRERMKPVLDFLDVAKRCAGGEAVIDVIRHAHDKASAAQTGLMPWEEFETVARREWSVPDISELLRAFWGAFLITPTPQVEAALLQAFAAVLEQQQRASGQELSEKKAGDAIKSAERLVERYLAEV